MSIIQIPCLEDNYAYILRCDESNQTLLVDTPCFTTIDQFLTTKKWPLTAILNTHTHWDHIAGNKEFYQKYNCNIYTSSLNFDSTPNATHTIDDGSQLLFGNIDLTVLATPGHTKGHICYVWRDKKSLLVGDTLFSIGCGRVFDGNVEALFYSLKKIALYPNDFLIYCAHEYTQKNLEFARLLLPDLKVLDTLQQNINHSVHAQQPTIPSTLAYEKQYNPFLLCETDWFIEALSPLTQGKKGLELFTLLRQLKDNF